jgi:4-amino-4-deoxy-L-arabinose transferase-like glycosyltransferase
MREKKQSLNNYSWVFLLLISAIGVILDLSIIGHGAGATGDAVWYMQGAENILKGYGYGIIRGDGFLPTTLYPPFYSIFLAGFGWFGISIYKMAGVLNAMLLGINIYLTGWIIHRLTGSAAASIFASAFALLSFDLFVLHTWVMSEPLYITLTLLSLLLTLNYRKNQHLGYLLMAGLLAGLSVITRYVGISLVATLCLWILVFGNGTKKRQIMDTAVLAILGLLPVALFFLRNAAFGVSIAGRSALVFHPLPPENIISFGKTILSWYIPGILLAKSWMIKKVIIIFLLLISVVFFLFSIRRSKPTQEIDQQFFVQFEFLMLIFLILYGATFMSSIYLSLAGSPTSSTGTQISRYLTPIFPIFCILAILICHRVHGTLFNIKKVYSIVVFVLGFAVLALFVNNFRTSYNKGIDLGYTDMRNAYPALVAELESIDPARPLIASNYELVYFLAGRPVYSMPGEGDELTGIANPDLPLLLAKITDALNRGGILVVYRSSPDQTFYYESMIKELTMLNTYANGRSSFSLYEKPGMR